METDRDSLRRLLERNREFDSNELGILREKLDQLSEPDTLSNLFADISADEQWLSDIAERSYQHEIGFDKLILISMENPERKLRLHIWDSETIPQSKTEAHIHNHRWNFCSLVLTGMLQFDIFNRGEGRTVHEYEYSPVGTSSEYSLETVGKTELRKVFGGSFERGVDYDITHDVIHRTYVDHDEFTATLMFQGPEMKSSTNVFNEQQVSNPDSMTVERISEPEILDRFRTVLAHI